MSEILPESTGNFTVQDVATVLHFWGESTVGTVILSSPFWWLFFCFRRENWSLSFLCSHIAFCISKNSVSISSVLISKLLINNCIMWLLLRASIRIVFCWRILLSFRSVFLSLTLYRWFLCSALLTYPMFMFTFVYKYVVKFALLFDYVMLLSD